MGYNARNDEIRDYITACRTKLLSLNLKGTHIN
jgi:hypothetical protein